MDSFQLHFGFRNDVLSVVNEAGRVNPDSLFVFEQLGSPVWGCGN